MTIKEAYSPSNPKVDLYVDGKYHSSTNWSKTVKHAVQTFKEKFPEHAEKKISGSISESTNMSVEKLIRDISENREDANDTLQSLIVSRIHEAFEEKKREIADAMFNKKESE